MQGVVYRPLVDDTGGPIRELPLAAAWVKGSHDHYRDELMKLLQSNLEQRPLPDGPPATRVFQVFRDCALGRATLQL